MLVIVLVLRSFIQSLKLLSVGGFMLLNLKGAKNKMNNLVSFELSVEFWLVYSVCVWL